MDKYKLNEVCVEAFQSKCSVLIEALDVATALSVPFVPKTVPINDKVPPEVQRLKICYYL